jgi:hypothetical protein
VYKNWNVLSFEQDSLVSQGSFPRCERLDRFSFLVISFAGWINQRQQQVIEYLVEENRVLRDQIGNRRIPFSDDQRRRLAARAKKLGRESSGASRDYWNAGDTLAKAVVSYLLRSRFL